MNYPFILVLLFLIVPCDNLPTSFDSYDHAISTVRSATFKIEDNVNTQIKSSKELVPGAKSLGTHGVMIRPI